jgi:hypothetical protein
MAARREPVEPTRPTTLEPDAAAIAVVASACHATGFAALTCGMFGDVPRFPPPLPGAAGRRPAGDGGRHLHRLHL